MLSTFRPWQLLVVTAAGWVNRDQQAVIHYLQEENRVLREHLGKKRSLRKATHEYAAHYHRERNHQGIDNRLIEPDRRADSAFNPIKCAQRLGGMLRFYHRAAA